MFLKACACLPVGMTSSILVYLMATTVSGNIKNKGAEVETLVQHQTLKLKLETVPGSASG